jgi:hypothetical protein
MVYGFVRSEDERERWINPGSRMTPAEVDDVVRAMETEGPQAAAARLHKYIDRYVPGMRVVELYELDTD